MSVARGFLLWKPTKGRYEDGKLVAHDIPDIKEYWKEDSVAFLSE